MPSVLGVVVMDHDFIAEEAGRFGPPMSDQGLVLGEFQPQAVAQELSDLGLDILGLPSRTGVAQQPIVRLCRLPGYAAWAVLLLVRPVSGVVHAA